MPDSLFLSYLFLRGNTWQVKKVACRFIKPLPFFYHFPPLLQASK